MTDLVLARKWIDALRSGEYTQSFGQLTKDYTSFCCLGVACEVADYQRADLHPSSVLFPRHANCSGYTGSEDDIDARLRVHMSQLPPSLTARLGLLLDDGTLCLTDDIADVERTTSRFGVLRLSELNDSYKFTFAQIADVLEFYYFGNEAG